MLEASFWSATPLATIDRSKMFQPNSSCQEHTLKSHQFLLNVCIIYWHTLTSKDSMSLVFHEFPCDWECAKIHGFLWYCGNLQYSQCGSDASGLHPIRAHICRVNHLPPRCERSGDHDGVVAPPIRTRNRPKEHALAGKVWKSLLEYSKMFKHHWILCEVRLLSQIGEFSWILAKRLHPEPHVRFQICFQADDHCITHDDHPTEALKPRGFHRFDGHWWSHDWHIIRRHIVVPGLSCSIMLTCLIILKRNEYKLYTSLFFFGVHTFDMVVPTMNMKPPSGQLDSTHSRPSLASSATSEKPRPAIWFAGSNSHNLWVCLPQGKSIWKKSQSLMCDLEPQAPSGVPACSKSRTRVPVSLLGTKGIAVPLGLFSSSSTSWAWRCTKHYPVPSRINLSLHPDGSSDHLIISFDHFFGSFIFSFHAQHRCGSECRRPAHSPPDDYCSNEHCLAILPSLSLNGEKDLSSLWLRGDYVVTMWWLCGNVVKILMWMSVDDCDNVVQHSEVSAWHLQSARCQPLVTLRGAQQSCHLPIHSSRTVTDINRTIGFSKTSKIDSVASDSFEFTDLAEPLALGDFGERGGEIMFCGTSTCSNGIAKVLQHLCDQTPKVAQMKIDPSTICTSVEYLHVRASSKLVANKAYLCAQAGTQMSGSKFQLSWSQEFGIFLTESICGRVWGIISSPKGTRPFRLYVTVRRTTIPWVPPLTSWRLELYAARKVAFARSPHSAMAKMPMPGETWHSDAGAFGLVGWIDLLRAPENPIDLTSVAVVKDIKHISHISDHSLNWIMDWTWVLPFAEQCRNLWQRSEWQCAYIKHHQSTLLPFVSRCFLKVGLCAVTSWCLLLSQNGQSSRTSKLKEEQLGASKTPKALDRCR